MQQNLRNVKRGIFLAIYLGLLSATLYAAADTNANNFAVEKDKVVPLLLKKTMVATGGQNVEVDAKWAQEITVFDIQSTSWKALQFVFVDNGKIQSLPPYFVVISEANLKNAQQDPNEPTHAAVHKPARIVLSLASMRPYYGLPGKLNAVEYVRPLMVNFLSVLDEPLTVEIRNDTVEQITSWSQQGNYFYREKASADLPKLLVKNISLFDPSKQEAPKSGKTKNQI